MIFEHQGVNKVFQTYFLEYQLKPLKTQNAYRRNGFTEMVLQR
jgi:hypothetical protein